MKGKPICARNIVAKGNAKTYPNANPREGATRFYFAFALLAKLGVSASPGGEGKSPRPLSLFTAATQRGGGGMPGGSFAPVALPHSGQKRLPAGMVA